jgi:hypothetical protein
MAEELDVTQKPKVELIKHATQEVDSQAAGTAAGSTHTVQNTAAGLDSQAALAAITPPSLQNKAEGLDSQAALAAITTPSLQNKAEGLDADQYVLSQLLENAVNSMCVIRIYPGLRSDYLVSLMDKGVKNFFLELYDTGTAGFREGPYSLKRAFTLGKRRGAHFYCSSQQEGIVDFSGYTSSRELWRAGAVPMGPYTTETTVARFLAASIIADSDDELSQLMDAPLNNDT